MDWEAKWEVPGRAEKAASEEAAGELEGPRISLRALPLGDSSYPR